MHKASLLKTSAGTTSSAPLRIPRKNPKKAPNVVDSSKLPAPRVPTVTFLMSRVDALTSTVERLESNLEKKELKNAQLVEDLNKLHLSFHTKLAWIARVVGVEHALTLSR
jgi:uncharacterized small protein (DUF1192 family)